MLVIATYYLKIYKDLQNYISILDSTFGVIIGALIGTLALIFSGIVFWGSLFDKKFRKKIIEYTKDEKTVDKLYISYWEGYRNSNSFHLIFGHGLYGGIKNLNISYLKLSFS